MELYEILWRATEKPKKPAPTKMSGEQLALATGTRVGVASEVRAAIAQAAKGRADKTTAGLSLQKRRFTLVEVFPDRTLGRQFPLKADTATVGRQKADLTFPEDPLMSREHAVFRVLGGALYVEDLDSANGVFVRIRKPHPVKDGDMILLGRQMFRLCYLASSPEGPGEPPGAKEKEPEAPVAELIRILRGGQEEKHFSLRRGENVFGRTQGSYTFPDDPFLSRGHAKLVIHGPRCIVEDLNSTNGTFVRIHERQLLDEGDTVLVGSQLLRVSEST